MKPLARIKICEKLLDYPWEPLISPKVQRNGTVPGNRKNGYIIWHDHELRGKCSAIDKHGEVLDHYKHLITDEEIIDERLIELKRLLKP